MQIIEVTLITGTQYRQSVKDLCAIYERQTEPFIIIHCYDDRGDTPLHERIRAMLKSWRVLNASKWQKKIIFVGRENSITNFLVDWIKHVLPITYEQHCVDTIEDARALAHSIIADHQGSRFHKL